MANEFVAEPDLQFAKDLIDAGAGDVKKCYQCATCSVACRIAPDNNPLPAQGDDLGPVGPERSAPE